jgi:hypothetical protein
MCPDAATFDRDQSRFPEDFEMMGNGRLPNTSAGKKIADTDGFRCVEQRHEKR